MLLSLLGSHVNIPLYAVPVERLLPAQNVVVFGRAYVAPPLQEDGVTIIAINVGGALLPLILSLYLFLARSARWRMLLGIAVVAAIVHSLAQIVPGVGIAVPMVVPPLAAAAVSLVLAFRRAPPVAYVSGSMGALIGAGPLEPSADRGAGRSRCLDRRGRHVRRRVSHGHHRWATRLSAEDRRRAGRCRARWPAFAYSCGNLPGC